MSKQGDVVRVRVTDPRGNVKVRPVVILTSTSEIILDSPLVAVAVTSSFAAPTPKNMVELPWARPPIRTATGLVKRSAAVCDWLVTIKQSDIVETMGFVPTSKLLDVAALVQRLNTRPL